MPASPATASTPFNRFSSALIVLLLFFLMLPVSLTAGQDIQANTLSDLPDPFLWVTDTPVHSVLCAGDVTYIGGEFTYVGPNTGQGVILDIADGDVSSFSRVEGVVNAAVPDASGGFFIGGYFNEVGGMQRGYAAHILADGSLDISFDPDADWFVNALALSPDGSTLYLGGIFNTIGGKRRNCLAAVDARTGQVTDFVCDTDDNVIDLALSPDGSTLYVGGYFHQIGGQPRSCLAAVDARTGQVTDFVCDVGDDNDVLALALSPDGSTLYVGGEFENIGGHDRKYLVAVEAATGEIKPWDPRPDGIVTSVLPSPDGSILYAGGFFGNIGGHQRNHLAALDTTTGSADPFDPDSDSIVTSLALSHDGSILYAGGSFAVIAGQARRCLAALDAATGVATPLSLNADDGVLALALSSDGTALYAGGVFKSIGGQLRNHLAALDNATGLPTGFNPGADGTVNDLVLSPDGSTLYVGGEFENVDGFQRKHLAAVNTITGSVTSFNPGADGSILSLALSPDGSTLYAGGEFEKIGGHDRKYLAAVNTATGAATAFAPDSDGFVITLALSHNGSTLYAGGTFNNIGGQSRHYIAALDADTGAATGFAPEADYYVLALALSHDGSTLYAGGGFGNIGGQPRDFLAALNTTTGSATPFDPGADAAVFALALSPDGSTLYAGGVFDNIGGKPRECVAALSTASGSADDWDPGLGDEDGVTSLALSGSTLYVGGGILTVGNKRWGNIARFNLPATTWDLAEGCTQGGMETWVLVQNPNPYAVTVSLTFMTSDGEKPGPRDYSIGANSRSSFRINDYMADWDVSTRVTASAPVVCERSVYGEEDAWAHNSIGALQPSMSWYFAEGCTEGDFDTWVLVQNPGNTDVAVSLTLMTSTGQVAGPRDITVPVASRCSFNLDSYVTDWDVSTRVIASAPVVCERAVYGGSRAWAHESIGAAQPSTTWYLAEGCTEGDFETWVLVQNPGTVEATVELTFMTSSGEVSGPRGFPIGANSRHSFRLNDYVTDWDVSTRVTASAPVVCERAVYGGSRAWAHDSVGVTAPSSSWYLAEGCTDGGMETFVLVQNPGAGPVHVNLRFQTGSGEVVPLELQGVEIPAASRRTFKINDYLTDYHVSTLVEATDGLIVCERAMYGNSRAWAHESVGYSP